jgi:hypothetical protein
METTTPLYSTEQIRVPPGLADLLKEYTKAAIKAAPEDLVAWSAQ